MSMTRRELLRELMCAGLTMTAATSILSGCSGGSAATSSTSAGGGSGKPIRIGFIPLTDCASVAMALELGLYKKHGLDNVTVEKQANWAVLRDKLSGGELEAAHCLFGMPFSLASGVSKIKGDPLKIAMTLSNNGQTTTLGTKAFASVGYEDYPGLKRAIEKLRKTKEPTFAMTYPGGTHDLWMHLSLATAGVDPNSVKIKVIPPPQMVANMMANNMDGFNVGEPWGGKAVADNVGQLFVASQDLWTNHPEKVLATNTTFAKERRDDLKKVMMAVLEASQWLDDEAKFVEHRKETAQKTGTAVYVNAKPEVIEQRLIGTYKTNTTPPVETFKEDTMLFYRGGETNFPRTGYGVWFLTQYMRFKMLKSAPDYQAIAKDVIMSDLYKEVADEMKVPIPDDDMKPFMVKADGFDFDPTKPDEALKMYASNFQKASKMA